MARPARDLHSRRWRAHCCRCSGSGASARSPTRSGSRWRSAHRALADAETCGRVLCALFPRLCANAGTVAEALAMLAPRRRRAPAAKRRRGREWSMAHQLPVELDFDGLPGDPGVYIFRDATGRPLYVGKSVSIRSRARAHFAPSTQRAAWTAHARDRRLPRNLLGARGADHGEPADQGVAATGQRPADRERRPSLLHPLPARHPVPGVGGGSRTGRGACRQHRATERQAVGRRAGRAARVAVRAAPLRQAPAQARASVGIRPDGALHVAVPRGP